ncbi:MAG: LPS-assembly protein LptD [Brevirhabdus sp.]
MLSRLVSLFALLMLLAVPLRAQAPAALIADSIAMRPGGVVVATGNVEVLREGQRLRAHRITYFSNEDRLEIEGPITLEDGNGILVIADAAALSADMRNGIMTGARLVLNQQMQIAAAEINRVDGRYSQMVKTVASSCHICADNPVPLWQIRASKIVHDQQKQQLYFHDAQFRVMDVPVMYLPRLRLPDPTLKRATGFLIPSVRNTNKLGTGLKLPYFIAIGDHKDLTLTPYATTEGSRTLEARYRQAFRYGTFEVNGALTRDRLYPNDWRGYLIAEGQFQLPRDYELSFNVERVSDRDYFVEYGYPSKDRLRSDITLQRTRRDSYFRMSAIQFETLRTTEVNAELPNPAGIVSYQKRFYPGMLGGRADLSVSALGFVRESNVDITGRDVRRLQAGLDWQRSWHTPMGIVGTIQASGAADFYTIRQDSTFPTELSRATGFGAVELRWPHERTGARARHLLEPVLQIVWSEDEGKVAPNEDSVLVEFDEGNLFSLGRFPGTDLYERGLRANLGLSWTRYDPQGWSLGLSAGRVIRAENLGQFTAASGLSGALSDWLVVTRIDTAAGLSLINRAVFDDKLQPTRNELRLGWNGERSKLATSYIWLEADPAEGRTSDTSELAFDGYYELRNNWFATTDLRYDFVANRASSSGIGLGYRNECISVDLSLSRRYASSTNVKPNTDFGLSVTLNGFGDRGKGRVARRSCMK